MTLPRAFVRLVLVGSLAAAIGCGSSHTAGGDAAAGGDGGAGTDAGTTLDGGARPDAGLDAGGGGACATLTEAECVGSETCWPLYDDFCCPSCMPVGFCADCSRVAMYRCVPVEEACGGGDACTVAGSPPCGEVPDCSTAVPGEGWRCNVPGCVARIEAACREGCFTECVPVTGDSCTAFCEIVPPDCPSDMVPEGDGSCYTGYCIATSACEPAMEL